MSENMDKKALQKFKYNKENQDIKIGNTKLQKLNSVATQETLLQKMIAV